jgi:2-O-methyltransferase
MKRILCCAIASLTFIGCGGWGQGRRPTAVQIIPHDANPRQVFAIIAPYLPKDPVILEGGAYDGKNSVMLAKLWRNATVHSFEPVPELYARVKAKTASRSNIHVYQLALSDKSGTATFHESESADHPDVPSLSGSLLPPKEHLRRAPRVVFQKTITVATTTIDAWAAENGVDRVDLLYLDIQGAELRAMKGAPRIMKTVKVIMTEVEFVEAYAGVARYQETTQWLAAQGFRMVAANFDAENPQQSGKWFGDAIFVRN